MIEGVGCFFFTIVGLSDILKSGILVVFYSFLPAWQGGFYGGVGSESAE